MIALCPAATAPPPDREHRTQYVTMGTLSRYTILFTGTSLRVEFLEFAEPADVRIPSNEYKKGNSTTVELGDLLAVEPLQMHIHTPSEHTVGGYYAPGELHIVTRVKDGESDYCDALGGCLAVFGTMLTFQGDGSTGHAPLDDLFNRVPNAVGLSNGITRDRRLNLDQFVPDNKHYFTYLGSLTTPPCSEIVTWHIYSHTLPVSARLIEKHQDMVSFTPGEDCTFAYNGVCAPPREKTNDRAIQPHHGRVVVYVED